MGISWKTTEGVYFACNQAFVKIVQVSSSDQIIGKNDFDLFPKKVALSIIANDKKVFTSKKTMLFDENVAIAHGKINSFISQKIPIFEKGEVLNGIVTTMVEVTKLKKKESILQGYIDGIFSVIPSHLFLMDKAGKIVMCSEQQARIFGLTVAQLTGKNIFDVAKKLGWQKEIPEKIREHDLKIMSQQVAEVLEEKIMIDGEERYYLTHKGPLKNASGDVIGIVGNAIDITDRKRVEALERGKTISRIKDLRVLGGIIAHELRTPLGAITLNCDLIDNAFITVVQEIMQQNPTLYEEKIADLFAKAIQYREKIDNVIKRTVTTIDLLLNNIREEHINRNKFRNLFIDNDIENAIKNYPFFDDAERERVHYDKKGAFSYFGDPYLTQLVLTNLLKNALYHIRLENKGEVFITLKNEEHENYLVFFDTGPGIPQKLLPNIFERFVTGRAGGTGLGLSFCKMVLEAYQGSIACASKENEYTKFTLRFPVCGKKPEVL